MFSGLVMRFTLLVTAFSLTAVLVCGCAPVKSPYDFLGMTVDEARVALGQDGGIMYVQRGVATPSSFTGNIVLSPYTIRQPARDSFGFVHCSVESGTIVDCRYDNVEDDKSDLLRLFLDRKLSEVPIEFYMQMPSSSHDYPIPISSYRDSLGNFSGVTLFHTPEHLLFLRFWEGVCIGVDIERDY